MAGVRSFNFVLGIYCLFARPNYRLSRRSAALRALESPAGSSQKVEDVLATLPKAAVRSRREKGVRFIFLHVTPRGVDRGASVLQPGG